MNPLIGSFTKKSKYDQDAVNEAYHTIRQAMIDDSSSKKGGLANAWHCALATCFEDELMNSESSDAGVICNAAASKFMKMFFDVDTKA